MRHGIEKCLEKMICFTDQLRRLKVDQFEYVSMKLICLLTSGMKEEQTLSFTLLILERGEGRGGGSGLIISWQT